MVEIKTQKPPGLNPNGGNVFIGTATATLAKFAILMPDSTSEPSFAMRQDNTQTCATTSTPIRVRGR